MNKNKMLLLLAIGMIMGGCGKKQNSSNSNVNTNQTDTLFVAGVLDQPASLRNGARKYLLCVDKKKTRHYLCESIQPGHSVHIKERDSLVSYIERGDTIVVENGVIVKNITMDNMINRYVNGR